MALPRMKALLMWMRTPETAANNKPTVTQAALSKRGMWKWWEQKRPTKATNTPVVAATSS